LFKIVIPARYASARLPGKPLLVIAGKPMLHWVYERACGAGAEEVLIATDDERIAASARAFIGVADAGKVVMTSATHASGTDRIAEVARVRGWSEQQIVVNVQGDEPLLPPQLVRQVAALLERYTQADIATLATPILFASCFLAFCVLSTLLVFVLGRDFFPTVDSGQMKLHARAPAGTYASEALGRKMTLTSKLAGASGARPVAEEYLRRFPNGTYAGPARAFVRVP
jgi:hypothetical protein